MRFATVSTDMSLTGMASGLLENRSTMVTAYFKPSESGSGPMRSMWTWSKRWSGIMKVAGYAWTCRPTFARWPEMQFLAHLVTSLFIEGHTYLCATILTVIRPLGCDKPWQASRTLRRKASGTNGRISLVETSQ